MVGVNCLGMDEMAEALLERWRIDEAEARRRMYQAPTPRERESWHVLWLLAQGWTSCDGSPGVWTGMPTPCGQWTTAFAEGGPRALSFEQSGGSPRAERGSAGRIEGGASRGRHRKPCIDLSNWNWKAVPAICVGPVLRVVAEPEQLSELPPSTRGQALHRLGFVLTYAPRSDCARRTRYGGKPSWWSTPR